MFTVMLTIKKRTELAGHTHAIKNALPFESLHFE
jgi:hypothetical protein